MVRKKRTAPEVNAGSMADIAFLLLIFFLVTTQIASDKGLLVKLPPKPEDEEKQEIDINKRNIFEILANSNDQLLVEGEPLQDVYMLKDMVKEFVLNPQKKENLSVAPNEAVVAITPQRGTSYSLFLTIRDQVESAYTEMYAEKVDLTPEEFLKLEPDEEKDKKIIDKATEAKYESISEEDKRNGKVAKLLSQGFPKMISITVPKK